MARLRNRAKNYCRKTPDCGKNRTQLNIYSQCLRLLFPTSFNARIHHQDNRDIGKLTNQTSSTYRLVLNPRAHLSIQGVPLTRNKIQRSYTSTSHPHPEKKEATRNENGPGLTLTLNPQTKKEQRRGNVHQAGRGAAPHKPKQKRLHCIEPIDSDRSSKEKAQGTTHDSVRLFNYPVPLELPAVRVRSLLPNP